MNLIRISLILLLFVFCTDIHAQELIDTVVLYDIDDVLPEDARYIGKIKVGDGTYHYSDFDFLVDTARRLARNEGANMIRVTKLKSPNALNSGYKMYADIYYSKEPESFFISKKQRIDSTLNSILDSNASYALLVVYRDGKGFFKIVEYDLHVRDSIVGKIQYNTARIIKLNKEGRTRIWARTEWTDEVYIDVKPGKIYFVRCSVSTFGALMEHPRLKLLSAEEGVEEFLLDGYDKEVPDADWKYKE